MNTMAGKINNKKQDPEYGVDSRYQSKEEKDRDSLALMQARIERMKGLSPEQVRRARLLQLKLKMENYLEAPVYDNRNHFTEFLEMYIDAIYTKRSSFAEDISIRPVLLSQVINNHREPKEEFMMKLMIHSEFVFKDVCEFHKKTWYQVYFQEKICETMSSQAQWRPKIEKKVKFRDLLKNNTMARG
jgi:hypothetical protein